MTNMQEKSRMKKQQKSKNVANRAWKILRLALLWARKGGVLKNRVIMDLRVVPKYLKKNLRQTNDNHQSGALYYGERQLSFDDTPILHIKMHRPSSLRFLPSCIVKPEVDFDYDFDLDDEEIYYNNNDNVAKNENENENNDDESYEVCEEVVYDACNDACDDEIDIKAEKFIANFYEQMRLQRQISYLQYN